ncbi:MAG: CRTAC1 family protein, partial [Acidobacteriota bacterium]
LPWALAVLACSPEADLSSPSEPISRTDPFADVTADSGVVFTHDNGASDDRLLPETMGSGVAVIDYDGDGWSDLFFVNGSPGSTAALYRNLGGWTFEDVTERAGVAVQLVGMGVAAGDFDRNGATDLFISGVGRDVLLRNRGDGSFDDASLLLADLPPGFGSSAAFLDADRDGWLDLFVGRYVTWSSETDVACLPDGEHRSYCTPEVYAGASNRLLRNRGNGEGFSDVTVETGLYLPEGKTLGVVPLDYNADGWPDLAVANDTVRNFLFVNRGDGTFEEQGVELGMAFSESGAPRGGMGIDAGDLSGAGAADLVIGNFAQEMSAVFRSRSSGLFADDAAQVGIGLPSLLRLAFGTLIFDFDLDGWNDVMLANGHIEPEIESLRPNQSYTQPISLYRHLPGESRFEIVDSDVLSVPRVARGLASGDFDRDGDLDIVVTQNGGPAVFLRNDTSGRSWLGLVPTPSSQQSVTLGTRVEIEAERRLRHASLVSGRSYLSASEPSIVFGLAAGDAVERVDIVWPSGNRTRLIAPAVNRFIELVSTLPRV